MTSRVRVDAPLCDHWTLVEAVAEGEGTRVSITSDCKSVQTYAQKLQWVSMDDLMRLEGSAIIRTAEQVGLTATCLVPVAVYNVCWMEHGMISKNLAMKNRRICIEFLD